MPVSYVIDKENRLVISTATGVVTSDEIYAFRRQILQDPDFDPSFSQLGDLSSLDTIDLDADEVKVLAERSVFSLASRRALVGTNLEVYGLGRMFEIVRGLRGDQQIRVFRTRDEALDWLLGKQQAA
jgi:hypothetical protein